jgi:hypothetical protein
MITPPLLKPQSYAQILSPRAYLRGKRVKGKKAKRVNKYIAYDLFSSFRRLPLLLTHSKINHRIKTGSLSISMAKGINRQAEVLAIMSFSLFAFSPQSFSPLPSCTIWARP